MEIEHSETAAVAPSAASEVMKANTPPEKAPQAVPQEPKAEQPKIEAKKEGWAKVDFASDDPKKVEQRFNRLYKQVKDNQRDLSERDEVLRQQSELIKELHAKQSQVVTHIQNQDYVAAESTLKSQRKEARDAGDLDRVDDINDRLEEIRIQKLTRQNQPKQPQAQQQQAQPRPQNAREAAQYAVSQGALEPETSDTIAAWQEEAGDSGETLRPWAESTHEDYGAALAVAKTVFAKYQPHQISQNIDKILAEVDRRMGLDRPQPQQQVMPTGQRGGNLTRGNGKRSMGVQMSDRAASMAVRMKFAGPGKSDEAHIDAYKAQIAKVRGGLQ